MHPTLSGKHCQACGLPHPGAFDSYVPRSEGVTELDRLQVHHANTASVLLTVKDKYTIPQSPRLSYMTDRRTLDTTSGCIC